MSRYFSSIRSILWVRFDPGVRDQLDGKDVRVEAKPDPEANARRRRENVGLFGGALGRQLETGLKVMGAGAREALTAAKVNIAAAIPLIPKDGLSRFIDATPSRSMRKVNSFRFPDELDLTLNWSGVPFDSRLIRAMMVFHYEGTTTPAGFALGRREQDPSQPTPTGFIVPATGANLRFIGQVDEISDAHEESGDTVSLKARDLTAVLIDTKMPPNQQKHLKPGVTIVDAIFDLLSNDPEFDVIRGPFTRLSPGTVLPKLDASRYSRLAVAPKEKHKQAKAIRAIVKKEQDATIAAFIANQRTAIPLTAPLLSGGPNPGDLDLRTTVTGGTALTEAEIGATQAAVSDDVATATAQARREDEATAVVAAYANADNVALAAALTELSEARTAEEVAAAQAAIERARDATRTPIEEAQAQAAAQAADVAVGGASERALAQAVALQALAEARTVEEVLAAQAALAEASATHVPWAAISPPGPPGPTTTPANAKSPRPTVPQPTATRQPTKAGAGQESYWDAITDICVSHALVPMIDRDQLIIIEPRTFFRDIPAGIGVAEPTFPAPDSRRALVAPNQHVRRMVYGRNIRSLRFGRKFARIKAPAVQVTARNPDAKDEKDRLVSATWPKDLVKARQDGTLAAPDRGAQATKQDPSGQNSSIEVVNYEIRGVTDPAQLLKVAEQIFEQMGRQELGVMIATDELASYTESDLIDLNNEPDLLDLRAGDPIQILVAPSDQSGLTGLQSLSELSRLVGGAVGAVAGTSTAPSRAKVVDYLVGRGMARDAANQFAGVLLSANVPNVFRVAGMSVSFQEEQGFQIQIDARDYVRVRVDGAALDLGETKLQLTTEF